MPAVIELKNLTKTYRLGDEELNALDNLDCSIQAGEFVAITGPSGSGKSTLLRILSGLARPSAGEVLWHGKPLDGRIPNVAIVFQSFALFAWLTVLENVEAALEALAMATTERHQRALHVLDNSRPGWVRECVPERAVWRYEATCGFRTPSGC